MPYVFLIFSLLLTFNIHAHEGDLDISREGDLDVWAGDYKIKIEATKFPGLSGAPVLHKILKTSHNHLLITWGQSVSPPNGFTSIYKIQDGKLNFLTGLRTYQSLDRVKGNHLYFYLRPFKADWLAPDTIFTPEIYVFKDGTYKLENSKKLRPYLKQNRSTLEEYLSSNTNARENLDVWAGDYKIKIEATKFPGLSGASTLQNIVITPYKHLWISYGNASPYFSTKVYSLQNGLKFIMSLHNRFAPVVKGKYLHFVDKSIGSWFTMFPGVWYGPEPRVVYEFKDGKYQVARKRMKKKPLSPKGLQQTVQAILQSTHFILQPENRMADHFTMMASQSIYSSPSYWGALFNLAYGGNMKQAVEVIEKVFASESQETKDQCIKDFKAILETSPYWEEIQKI